MIHVDRLEKQYIVVMAVVLGVFFASVVASGLVFGFNPPDATAFVNPQRLNETMFAQPGLRHMGDNRYDLVIVGQMWAFDLGEIERDATGHPVLRLPQGAEVTFHVTSRDVQHHIVIEQHNLNLQILPGQVSRSQIQFNRPGTYRGICGEYCGRGHRLMYLTIIVEPAAV